jgi:hypothetical protein
MVLKVLKRHSLPRTNSKVQYVVNNAIIQTKSRPIIPPITDSIISLVKTEIIWICFLRPGFELLVKSFLKQTWCWQSTNQQRERPIAIRQISCLAVMPSIKSKTRNTLIKKLSESPVFNPRE